MPDGEFRELNIMAFDDKPFYRELIDDEHGTNIYDEAIDRLWQTVQLLEITITAANTHIAFIDLDSELIAFDEEDPKTLPSLCLGQIPCPFSDDTRRPRNRLILCYSKQRASPLARNGST